MMTITMIAMTNRIMAIIMHSAWRLCSIYVAHNGTYSGTYVWVYDNLCMRVSACALDFDVNVYANGRCTCVHVDAYKNAERSCVKEDTTHVTRASDGTCIHSYPRTRTHPYIHQI